MPLNINPSYIEKDKKKFVVLPVEDFNKIEQALEDYEDLLNLRDAKSTEQFKKGKTISQVKKKLNIT